MISYLGREAFRFTSVRLIGRLMVRPTFLIRARYAQRNFQSPRAIDEVAARTYQE